MAHEVESMAYTRSGGVPWHGLGFPVSNDLNVDEMLHAAKLNWQVEKKAIQVCNGKVIPGKFALVRSDNELTLDIVGPSYRPIQNHEAFEFFRKFVEAGHMNMETAGSLRQGRFVWGLAKINKSFALFSDDLVEGYLLVSQPHIMGRALIIQFTPIRVVCMNTLSWALSSGLKGTAGRFSMPHVRNFDDSARSLAERALGLATEQMKEFQEASELLCQVRCTEETAEAYFREVFKVPEITHDDEPTRSRVVDQTMAALRNSPGSDLKAARGTVWGALNAVTYVIDHQTGTTRDLALENAWFGHRASIKRRAVDLAVELARGA